MGKLTRTELIASIAANTGHSKATVSSVLDAFGNDVTICLKEGNSFTLSALGTFKPVHRKARPGRNPYTGETIQFAASNGASFKPSKALKHALN